MSTHLSERTEGGVTGSTPFIDEAEDRSIGTVDERLEAADERFYYANPWKLIMWRFRRHRLAMISLVVLALLYLGAVFAEFISPTRRPARRRLSDDAPTKIHVFSMRVRCTNPLSMH